MKYDLHSHSLASDGTLTPAELVHQAAQAGVTHLALTDHDTLAGLPEAQRAADRSDIELISGIELSATWRGRTIHIVGLHVDVESAVLREGVRRQLDFRDWRGREIARRLEKEADIEGSYEGALSFAHGGLLSRSHFARYLVKAGYAKNFAQAIRKYLLRGSPGHVPGHWASLSEVLVWIQASNGIAVLAHPGRYKLTAAKLKDLLADFIAAGGEAIEVLSGSHRPDEVSTMVGYALRFDLLASAGSDYHGPDSRVHLGGLPEMPESCKVVWDSDIWHQRAAMLA